MKPAKNKLFFQDSIIAKLSSMDLDLAGDGKYDSQGIFKIA